MPYISGIQIEKDRKGRLAYARFNLKKHPVALELLTKKGTIEEDKFEKEWKDGISGDELISRLKPRIKSLFEK